MALPRRITAVEISAERDRHVYHARIVEPEASTPQARARGNLHVLLNLCGAGGGRSRLSRQVLNVIQATYYEQTTGSVTQSLTQALLAAHDTLRRANVTTPQAVWQASVACLVVRGRDLFIGHAGPALSFVAHPDAVDLFPAKPPEAEAYLGDPSPPDIEFFHTQLRGDTTVLLAEAGWLGHASAREMAAVAASPDPDASADYLREIAERTGLACLVITIETEPEAWSHIPRVDEEPHREASAGAGEAIAGEDERFAQTRATVPIEEMSEPLSRARATPYIPRSVTRIPRTVPSREQRAVEPAEAPSQRPRPEPVMEPEVEIAAEPGPLPEPFRWEKPTFSVRWPAWRLPRISIPWRRRGKAEARIARAEPQGSSRWAVIVAILIPLMTALLVTGVYWQRGAERARQLQELIAGAQAQVVAAAESEDPARARVMLDEAEGLLEEAELLHPGLPEIEKLRLQIQEQRDRISQVQLLYLVLPLKEFGKGDRDPSRVVVNEGHVFILDRGLDQVDHYQLDETGDTLSPVGDEPLLKKGQLLGETTVGEMVDMVWVPAGDGRPVSALLVLDASGNLWQWAENVGLTSISIAATEQWRYPQRLETYLGRLYLMDPQANTILRYPPAGSDYSISPEPYFTQYVDLAGAVDFSIDGNIWILFADGRVLKFFQGERQPFLFTGFPDKFRAPVALVAGRREGAPTDRLYIGDARDGRIIEFSKDGAFIRQLRPSDPSLFQDMRSLYVDETNKVFYVLTKRGLYKAPIPAPPQSP